jgi:hypothetical protein
MRVFPWLLSLALTIEFLVGYCLAGFIMASLADQQRAAPAFTALVFAQPTWWLLLPLPWFAYAFFLTRRTPPTKDAILVFAGVGAVFASLIFGLMVIASLLPQITLKSEFIEPIIYFSAK